VRARGEAHADSARILRAAAAGIGGKEARALVLDDERQTLGMRMEGNLDPVVVPCHAHRVRQHPREHMAHGTTVGGNRGGRKVLGDPPVAPPWPDRGSDVGDGVGHQRLQIDLLIGEHAVPARLQRLLVQVIGHVEQVGGGGGHAGGARLAIDGKLLCVAMQRHADGAQVVLGKAELACGGLLGLLRRIKSLIVLA
jgi:hypothetical protein